MNASVMYDVYQKMHMACSRIYPIALDYVHDIEKDITFKLPGIYELKLLHFRSDKK